MTSDTLRSIAQLRDAGFVSAAQTEALDEVAARYAVAITPTVAELIAMIRTTRSRANSFPIRPNSHRSRKSALIRSAMTPSARSRASSTAIRTACC
jgi:hypothetical protein